MVRDKKNLTIRILSIVVIILVLFIIYIFLVRPGINNYVITKQVEAQNYVFADMMVQLQNTGMYRIQVGENTLVLVPYQPSS